MEFLKSINRRKSAASEILYIVLNVVLAVLAMVLVIVTNTPWPAFALIVLSRWRVFAVRPRYWLANMQSDLVSLIVSLSFVTFLYLANGSSTSSINWQAIAVQVVFVALYIAWLLILRPQSKREYVALQAMVALFAGTSAIFSVTYMMPASIAVLLLWLVGCAVTRHIITSYDEESHVNFLTLAGGLLTAEAGWICYHWTIAYDIPFTSLMLPQASIIITCLGLLIYKCYDSYNRFKKIRLNDIILPLIFTVVLVFILLVFFNSVSVTSFS